METKKKSEEKAGSNALAIIYVRETRGKVQITSF